MKDRRTASSKPGNQDERGKRTEFIFAQFEFDNSNYVRNVLNEAKPRLDKTTPDKYHRHDY